MEKTFWKNEYSKDFFLLSCFFSLYYLYGKNLLKKWIFKRFFFTVLFLFLILPIWKKPFEKMNIQKVFLLSCFFSLYYLYGKNLLKKWIFKRFFFYCLVSFPIIPIWKKPFEKMNIQKVFLLSCFFSLYYLYGKNLLKKWIFKRFFYCLVSFPYTTYMEKTFWKNEYSKGFLLSCFFSLYYLYGKNLLKKWIFKRFIYTLQNIIIPVCKFSFVKKL
jgi:hypothetical protein